VFCTYCFVGKVFIYDGINSTYWFTINDHVADMSGDQFNQFLQWAGDSNNTLTYYNPWSVFNSFPDKAYVQAYECFQWAGIALVHIQSIGGKLMPNVTELYVCIAALYSSTQPVKADLNDPQWTNNIVEFYDLLSGNWNDLGPLGFFIEFLKLAEDQIFVYKDTSYYSVQLVFPYIEMHWTPLPIG